MKKLIKNPSIILFDDALIHYIDDKEIDAYIKNFGLQKFLDEFCINLSLIKKIMHEATAQDLTVSRINSSACQITFGNYSGYEINKKNELLSKILNNLNIKNKFYILENKRSIFYIQKIFSFKCLSKSVNEFTLPKQKTKSSKIEI